MKFRFTRFPDLRPALLTSTFISAAFLSACGGGADSAPGAPAALSTDMSHPAAVTTSPSAMTGLSVPLPLDGATAITTQPVSPEQTVALAQPFGGPAGNDALAINASAIGTSTELQSPDAAAVDLGARAHAEASITATDPAAEVRIFVETNGSDIATGVSQSLGAADGPVQTLNRAQQLARLALAAMNNGSTARLPVRVLIGPGTYPLSSTQVFASADSGTYAAPVSYEARQTGTVLISGGTALESKVAPGTATPLSFNAPTDAAMINGGSQLYVNGRRATLARQPNAGSAWFVQRATVLATDVAGNEGAEAFVPAVADLSWLANLSSSDKSRAIVDVMHGWTSSRHHLYSVGVPVGSIRVTPKSIWPFQNFGVSQRYFVENVLAALDAPGEWIYESGVIRYIRQNDEAGQQVIPVVPVLEKIILVQGESITKQVQNLRFRGLSFAYTRYLTTAAGFIDHQSASDLGAAIEVNKARGIVFDRCQFSQTAAWGIWLRDSVRESRVTNSIFTDMGAGGIRVGLTSQSASDSTASGSNQVNGNTVRETGKIFPGAAAIWLGQTWDNQVQWNNVYRTTHSGISVGWTWGYADAGSGRNRINGNLLYNIGLGQLTDLGGIYTLGKSPGTWITNNVIREVRRYNGNGNGGGWGAFGLYNDQGSSNIVMQNNVVIGTDSGGYYLQFGRDNMVHNNIFVAGDGPDIGIGRLDVGTNLTVRANLFVSNKPQVFSFLAKAPEVVSSRNEVSSSLSGTVDNSICGFGCVESKTAITTTSAPFSISTNSTMWQPIVGNALTANTSVSAVALLATPALALMPVIGKELLPPPLVATGLEWALDIAGTALGARPSTGFVYVLGGNSNSIKVVEKADAPGGKCLAYTDSASFINNYEPMAFAKLNHTTGTTVVEFNLQIDSATTFWHEWRDDSTPYIGGPTFFVSSKGVQVNGVTIASVDVGQWIKFKVTAPMGQQNAVWTLELTRANGERVTINNLAMKNPNFNRLNWLGFISIGVTSANSCLAGLKASNM